MNKVVLVTGAGKGLGKIIANTLSNCGFRVYGTYFKSRPSSNNRVKYFKLNVTSDSNCSLVVNKILKAEKGVDILVNCAGVSVSGPTMSFSAEDFKIVLDTNVVGPFRLIRLLSRYKLKKVINITSLNGFLSLPNYGLYAASKFAFEALGIALRYELHPSVQVTNIAPGAIFNEESVSKMQHRPIREKIALFKLIFPLTKKERVANEVVKVAQNANAPARIIIGRDAKIVYLIQRIIPSRILDQLFIFLWKRK